MYQYQQPLNHEQGLECLECLLCNDTSSHRCNFANKTVGRMEWGGVGGHKIYNGYQDLSSFIYGVRELSENHIHGTPENWLRGVRSGTSWSRGQNALSSHMLGKGTVTRGHNYVTTPFFPPKQRHLQHTIIFMLVLFQ